MTSLFPLLVIFGLEHVLLPFDFERDIAWPCSKKNGTIVDAKGQVITYYPTVPAIIEKLKNNSVKMAITYGYREIKGAVQIIDLFGWNKLFSYQEINTLSAVDRIRNIKKKAKFPFRKIVFFDCDLVDVRDVEQELGVLCEFTSYDDGILMKDIEEAFNHFKNYLQWMQQNLKKKVKKPAMRKEQKDVKNTVQKKGKSTSTKNITRTVNADYEDEDADYEYYD